MTHEEVAKILEVPEWALLSGIQKVEFAIGTKWRDKITDFEIEVIGQRPDAIIGVSPRGALKIRYFEHQLSRLEPLGE